VYLRAPPRISAIRSLVPLNKTIYLQILCVLCAYLSELCVNPHKHILIIGAGFSGISAATHLATQGYDVTVFEKNSTPGGRARRLELDGFTFDMGPSWYWMPDVFEKHFAAFGKKVQDYYKLDRLDPSYRVYFTETEFVDLPAEQIALRELFNDIEPGSGAHLDDYLAEAKQKYDIALSEFIYKPGLSWLEFARPGLLISALKLQIFQSISTYIRKFFKNDRLIQIMEFPVLFLGAAPAQTPALYSLMNYADIALGTWYPRGGMFSVVEGMVKLAAEMGVKFKFDSPVERLVTSGKKITAVVSKGATYECDCLVASADYHHVEQELLPADLRTYSKKYWNKRVLAPSSLLFYVGLNRKVNGLPHHTLFFDRDFRQHAREIYEDPQWPSDPQFYISLTTVTDSATAPPGCENLVILIPVAAGLEDTPEVREKYFQIVMKRLERTTGQSLVDAVVVKRTYAHNDFINDYHALKGNAYGLANTLMQTAVLKPRMKSSKVSNLYYCGQLTVPGPGVPTAIISGEIVAREVMK
jgi:phytoene desaturase